ncbi:phosphoribosyltransferase family protein [Stakelama sediminis]|uniref:Putative HAD superfamily protein/hypoxanthine phosphoribosyltransferase n=1 Tax=Stakelama sediminis TaxID=463200 RepID=A0A840Z2J6_9SPHN|nr:phosphoribosyltransferase family protein [Stakelama sediminis]MBB5719974.1 putative HAD superfamily protein/hypoxanthine phosphoribosyltransferase [Stakelama sediminis]
MHFRSVEELNRTIIRNLHRLPGDIDLIVGIPRSGMLAASLIALHKNLPLADLEGFTAGRTFASGKTRGQHARRDRTEYRHALIVDDSIRTGTAMREAITLVERSDIPAQSSFCAAYGTQDSKDDLADLILEAVPEPRLFEWNILHHPILESACVDIDGVLCLDPDDAENDDGPAYRTFLANARPLHRPSHRIGTLVTSRLERYRAETEAWLYANDIRYDSLRMLDLPDAATRRRLGAHGSFKASVYRELDSPIFIESELAQARTIAVASGKPVLSLEGPELCQPSLASMALKQGIGSGRNAKRLLRRIVGPQGYHKLRTVLRTGA